MTKNPLRRVAYTYSGSPWFLWLQATSSTLLTFVLFFERIGQPFFRILGISIAIVATFYWAALVYYLKHRAEFAINPVKPIVYTRKMVVWTVAILIAAVIGFVLLELFVWHD